MSFPKLRYKIINQLQIHLIKSNLFTFEDNGKETCSLSKPLYVDPDSDTNIGVAKLWSEKEYETVMKTTIDCAAKSFPLEEIKKTQS